MATFKAQIAADPDPAALPRTTVAVREAVRHRAAVDPATIAPQVPAIVHRIEAAPIALEAVTCHAVMAAATAATQWEAAPGAITAVPVHAAAAAAVHAAWDHAAAAAAGGSES